MITIRGWETDVGLNLTFLDKRLSITPMIGFVHGQLLSSRGGFFPNGSGSVNERTTAFEGAVPNITVNWLDDRFESEFYMGYYKAIRSEGGSPSDPGPICPLLVEAIALAPLREEAEGLGIFSTTGPTRASASTACSQPACTTNIS